MARSMLILEHRRTSDLQLPAGLPARSAAQRFLNLFHGFIGGNYSGSASLQITQAQATGTITLSNASGTVTVIINGTAVSTTAAGGDIATATVLAAAINNSVDPLMTQHVRASNLDANGVATNIITLTALTPGPAGNAVMTSTSGTGIVASGVRMSGGTITTYSMSASP